MKIRLLPLCALAALCAHAESVGLYYSFDVPPHPRSLSAMQAELDRILEPAGLSVEWRELGHAPPESFGSVVVVRFHADAKRPGRQLAATRMDGGHVLPFADVNCARIEEHLAPMKGDAPAVLGRAMARVVAHEIYHMLTGSDVHAGEGIARAEHSRSQLLADTFRFGQAERDWLRALSRGVLPELDHGLQSVVGIGEEAARQPAQDLDVGRPHPQFEYQ